MISVENTTIESTIQPKSEFNITAYVNSLSLEELRRLSLKFGTQQPECPILDPSYFYNCNGSLGNFAVSYKSIHGYVSLAVCIFGTIANILNLVVLTRKELSAAPINRVLTGLALADMLVMIEYVPFASYRYIVFPDTRNFPYSWAIFLLFHAVFSQVLHTISICLTLALAVWRYIAIRHPQHSISWCTDGRCNSVIATCYILPIFVCIPTYFVIHIRKTVIRNETLYHVDNRDILMDNILLNNIYFWIYAVMIKLLPCLILTVLSCCLILTLNKVNKRKKLLKGYNTCNSAEMFPCNIKRMTRSEKRAYRTTKMLVAILILFLVTEFPQGILSLLSAILGICYFKQCYMKFAELMDILALINGAINFILYCFMSRQFRTTFGQLFKPRALTKWVPRPSQTHSIHSTYV